MSTPTLPPTFQALNKEAQFTCEMLCAGATQIRCANYARKGIYFQAFTSLSTGLERIGKLCLMLDHYIDHDGAFPDDRYMKQHICHKIGLIYQNTVALVARRSIPIRFLQNLDDPIHHAILTVLNDFAQGDRYCNINLLIGRGRPTDPVSSWYTAVDLPLFDAHVTQKRKDTLRRNAAAVATMLGSNATVFHTAETGDEMTDIEEASHRAGVQDTVAPLRQLYVLHIVRYWAEVLTALQYLAMHAGRKDIPFFDEVFGLFFNDDSYFKKHKTWNTL